MKWLLIVLSMLLSFARAQDEITSFFLKTPVEVGAFEKSVPNKICANYTLASDSSLNLVLDSLGISMVSKKLTVLSLSDIQAKSEWYLNQGKLFGIVKNQGLPYIERNDSFFFALELTNKIYSIENNAQKMSIAEESILIYQKAGDHWLLNFKVDLDENGLHISTFDHEPVLDHILQWSELNETVVNGYKTYIGNPQKSEWEHIVKNEAAFSDSRYFVELIGVD